MLDRNESAIPTTSATTPPPSPPPSPPPPPPTDKYNFTVPIGLQDNMTITFTGIVHLHSTLLEANISITLGQGTNAESIPVGGAYGILNQPHGFKVEFSGALNLITGKGGIYFQKGSTTVVMLEMDVKKEDRDVGPGVVQLLVLPTPTTSAGGAERVEKAGVGAEAES